MTSTILAPDALSDERFDRGQATFTQLTGLPASVFIESLESVAPGYARKIIEWEFADVLGQSSLDVRTQEIVALANLATLGASAAPFLKFRISTALRSGVSRQEIIDVFIQIGLGAGLPVALAAIKVAETAFAEHAST